MSIPEQYLRVRVPQALAILLMVLGLTFALPAAAFDLRIETDQAAEDDLRDAVRNASLLAELEADTDRAATDIVANAKADYARVIAVLYDRGFFGGTVSIRLDGVEASSLSTFQSNRRVANAVIRVSTGAPFRFGRTVIAPVTDATEISDDFARGAPASVSVVRENVATVLSGWRDVGHAKADVATQTITADHASKNLDVDIKIAPGPKLRFGTLNVRGDTALTPERVRQIAGLPSGAVFDPKDVQRVTTRLRRTGVFSSVSVREAETIGPNETLDIDLQLSDAPLRRFGFGAELSSQDGLELSAFWLHRNLLGGGERLRLDGKVGGIGGETGGEDFELGLSFVRPATPTFRTDVFFDADISRFDEPNFKADRVSLALGLKHYASDNRFYSYAIGYEAAETEDAFGERSYRILTLPLRHERDYRNNELNATAGYYANFSLTPFAALSGTDDGARVFVDGRVYRSVGTEDRVTFALRGQLGALFGPTLSRAPADYLFYSGGGGTVRGHEYQSLGIDLPSGQTTGGRSFVGLSAEMRVKTGERLSLVGFWDAGFIGEDALPSEGSGQWHTGAGVGLRYDTGVGPIRVDIGVPLTGPGSNSGFELYIGIGQAF